MDIKKFAINRLNDDALQEILENKLRTLLKGPLSTRDDYAKEKCLLSFTEPLLYLERSLLDKEGLSPNDLPFILLEIGGKDCMAKLEKVRNIMVNEISRQYRNFIAFL